jgi:tRNA pseudouridine38-40 synthase
MHRYFLEVSYKGSAYSGFQSQHNANTVQNEIEKALQVLFKRQFFLTGSSRTDAGVHALQNYFHFDDLMQFQTDNVSGSQNQVKYKLNAILPHDIVVKKIYNVSDNAHCRFDVISREYKYYIYQQKNPFLSDRAFYFPYKLNIDEMQLGAALIKEYDDFTSFSKRNTQVKTFLCKIEESQWIFENNCLIYKVKSNRFLRGMVRALTATLLQVGRGKLSLEDLRFIIEARDCTKASFAVPAHGLFLVAVQFTSDYFSQV